MSDQDVKTMHKDTPTIDEGASAAGGVRIDDEQEGHDPKSGGTPVHPAPTEDTQEQDAES